MSDGAIGRFKRLAQEKRGSEGFFALVFGFDEG